MGGHHHCDAQEYNNNDAYERKRDRRAKHDHVNRRYYEDSDSGDSSDSSDDSCVRRRTRHYCHGHKAHKKRNVYIPRRSHCRRYNNILQAADAYAAVAAAPCRAPIRPYDIYRDCDAQVVRRPYAGGYDTSLAYGDAYTASPHVVTLRDYREKTYIANAYAPRRHPPLLEYGVVASSIAPHCVYRREYPHQYAVQTYTDTALPIVHRRPMRAGLAGLIYKIF